MELNNFPSKILAGVVDEFSKLPGVGRKTALRFALHLLKQQPEETSSFGNAVLRLNDEIRHCRVCNNVSDHEICDICSNPSRDKSLICVVESVRDVMAIENTSLYKGVYHVLGGIISPMDGIGPNDLNIASLIGRVEQNAASEIILALSTTMEGDTTNFYLYKKLKSFPLKITTIARGIAFGDELEYADEITLGRSIVNRTQYETTLSG